MTLTAAQATARWPAGESRFDRGECPAMYSAEVHAWAAIHAGAERDRFTGTILGEPVADSEGDTWQAVFYYEAGVCTDRHMTKTGTQL